MTQSTISTQSPDSGSTAKARVLRAGDNRKAECPEASVFAYTDYRVFLLDFYKEKSARNPSYTMSAFTRRAGLGANLRGYLKLVIEGKRNLTPHTLRAFVDALGLGAKEALYFENLVYFNQARTAKDKNYYFARLEAASEGRETRQFELMRSQYNYCSKWYLVAVRELVGLDHFEEDPAWIATRLRGKISRKEALEALEHLERMELIRREKGRYIQSEPLVKIPGGVFNLVVENFHTQMIDLAKESLSSDPYEERNVSAVTLSCDSSRIGALREAIARFRDQITTEFGVGNAAPDTVAQVNFQLFQLTTPSKKENSR